MATRITSYDGGMMAPLDTTARKYSETGMAFPQSYYETQGLSQETPGYREATTCVAQ